MTLKMGNGKVDITYIVREKGELKTNGKKTQSINFPLYIQYKLNLKSLMKKSVDVLCQLPSYNYI